MTPWTPTYHLTDAGKDEWFNVSQSSGFIAGYINWLKKPEATFVLFSIVLAVIVAVLGDNLLDRFYPNNPISSVEQHNK